jgi:hypothetical protein
MNGMGGGGPDFSGVIERDIAPYKKNIEKIQKEKQRVGQVIKLFEGFKTNLISLADQIKLMMPDIVSNISIADKIATISDSNGDYLSATATKKAAVGSYSIGITTLGTSTSAIGSVSFSPTAQDTALSVAGTFILNGVTITVVATDKPTDICDKINAASYASGAEVTASIINGKFQIATKALGSTAKIYGSSSAGTGWTNATDDPNSILETTLGIISAANAGLYSSNTGAVPVLSINGQTINSYSSSIYSNIIPEAYGIRGVSLSLKKVTVTPVELNIGFNYSQAYKSLDAILSSIDEICKNCDDALKRTSHGENGPNKQLLQSGERHIPEQIKTALTLPLRRSVIAATQNWHSTSTITVSANTAANSTTLAITGLSAADGKILYTGNISSGNGYYADRFTIDGHQEAEGRPYVYSVSADATVTSGAATLTIIPQLRGAISAGAIVRPETIPSGFFGVQVQSSATMNAGQPILSIDSDKFFESAAQSPEKFLNYFVRMDQELAVSSTTTRHWEHLGIVPQLYANLIKLLELKNSGVWKAKLYGTSSFTKQAGAKDTLIDQQIFLLNKKEAEQTKALSDAQKALDEQYKKSVERVSKGQSKIQGNESKAQSLMAMMNQGR